MNSVLKGCVTKRYSNDKGITLEKATIIRQNQLKQIRLKLFNLDKQKQHYEQYSIYLEETLSSYKEEEKIFAETKLNFTDGTNEIEENEKMNEDDSLTPVLTEKNDTYWKCFWCLTERGQNRRCIHDYTTHLKKCFKRKLFEYFYQNHSLKCYKCCGVKVVFRSCPTISSKESVFCTLCHSHCPDKNNNSLSKHMKDHQNSFSFLCSCTNNFVLNV